MSTNSRKPEILIVGHGVIGTKMHGLFPWADVHDPDQDYYLNETNVYDFAFICVPTDSTPTGHADITLVKEACHLCVGRAHVIVIKSTIPPGTTERIREELAYPPIVFSPEFFSETVHGLLEDKFMIIGGLEVFAEQLADLYASIKPASFRVRITDSRAAELVKYMDNAWLATKVTFCAEFFKIAEQFQVPYHVLRDLWLMDPRVNPSHTWVFPDHPYYDSHSLNKDVQAIVNEVSDIGYFPRFLDAVLDVNYAMKEKFNGSH